MAGRHSWRDVSVIQWCRKQVQRATRGRIGVKGQPYGGQAARRRMELILVISPESYAVPCTDLLSLPLPPIPLQLSRRTAHPRWQDGAAPCVTVSDLVSFVNRSRPCCPSFQRNCTRSGATLSLTQSVQHQIWRIFLEVTILSFECYSMRVSSRYLRKTFIGCVSMFNLYRLHPVAMYVEVKPVRHNGIIYWFLLLATFLGFWKKPSSGN